VPDHPPTTITLGLHEVWEPCGMIRRPERGKRPCRTSCGEPHVCLWCHDTDWIRKCTICGTVDCDGVHDFCLDCDGTGLVTCSWCEGEAYDDDQVACLGCKGSGELPCIACSVPAK
jgi:hypothetical protein